MKLVPLSVLFTFALGGCSYLPELPLLGEASAPPEPTLADLQPLPVEVAEAPVPQRSLRELETAYRDVLAATRDPAVQLKVRRRLADLDMMATESESLDESTGTADYGDVIASYQALLHEYPEVAGSDQLLYQMARAHDLGGRGDEAVALMTQLSQQHPDSEHRAEAEFRKGEAYFSAARYAAAADSYQRVVRSESGGEYYTNSLYMLGWSYFKQERNEQAIEVFTTTLDTLMPADNRLEALARGDREIASDCLRVLAVMFDYRGGSDAIAATYAALGERGYQPLIYAALGELYLQQERYQDSAQTYAGFIAANPTSPMAHNFQGKVIAVYQAAGFPQQVIEAKRDYVTAYSVAGPYWMAAEESARDNIRPLLAQYIDELARHYHSLAQSGEGGESRQQYLLAADYYGLYVNSFPGDVRVPDMLFLLAESREAAGEYRLAISAYQEMAYLYAEHPQAPEAAYAAIIAHGNQASTLPDDQLAMIDSQLSFARVFPRDPRAPKVLGSAATALLDSALNERAALAAAELVAWQPAPAADVLLPAWLVLGHAEFARSHYLSAENAYQGALALLPEHDARREETLENLAASIYRQGEMAAAAGEHEQAAMHFARVMDAAPTSGIRLNAQYDAASNYLLAGEYVKGNALLVDFRRRYPEHALTAGIGARLVENYELTGQWRNAAEELDGITATSDDAAVQREALYLAADYYQRAGNEDLAIERYRRYAHTWKTPLAPRMEAMLILADLYAQRAEPRKRDYWLNALADAHDTGGEEQDERSLYLAASSSSDLADGYYTQYLDIQLTDPLPQSLRRKRQALDLTVNAYERVNAYGVQAFGTRATYRLGDVYRKLSEELLASPRPVGLDALALEQYEILLEEQAWPFEEKAVAIHEANARRAWDGLFDPWIDQSFTALAELMPARWGKREQALTMSGEIR